MFSVIFEVFPHEERFDEYLALAKHLKPILETIDGFVDNERFESTRRPGWLLSHSTWRDEKSVVRWRTTGEHHAIQAKGRSEVFRDYHLRVGDVTADTDAPKEAPVREQRFDETEIGAAKLATLTEITPEPGTEFGLHDDLLTALGLITRRRRRARPARQHLQPRQAGATGVVAGCNGRAPVDAGESQGNPEPAASPDTDRA